MIFPFDKSISDVIGFTEYSAARPHGTVTHRVEMRPLESNNDENNVNRRNTRGRNACRRCQWT
jgi:hypothetical protein